MDYTCLQSKTLILSFVGLTSLFLPRSARRSVRKSLLEEVQELEARSVDPGAAVLRDASSRRYINATKHHGVSQHTYTIFRIIKHVLFNFILPHVVFIFAVHQTAPN